MRLNLRIDLRKRARAISLAMLFAILAPLLVNALPAVAATNGNVISRTNTIPRGAVFLSDANGGHWWVSDGVLGICELMPQNVAGQPPFVPTNCNGTAKAGAQLVVGSIAPAIAATLPANSRFLYVADNASKSVHVVRFVFNPAGNGGLVSNTQFNINNVTAVGGGAGGGRPTGIALLPHSGLAANGGSWDLYTGYKASGDIIRVDGVDAVALNTLNPPQAKVGNTSDGRGVNALLAFGNDLYVAEIGGFGLSRIADPSGLARPACSATSVCASVSVSPQPDFFPGGLATDYVAAAGVQNPTAGKVIFIGDAQLGVPQSKVLRYDPATGAADVYSQTTSPSYTEAGVTYTAYMFALGLGYNPVTGDLYVGDDPQASAGAPVLQQGHIWKVAAAAAVPTVTSILPTSGDIAGGTAVTVTGTGFVPGGTTINFGANAGTGVVCASVTSCTATSPVGTGVVDVTVAVGGQTSAISAADQFTYVVNIPNAVTVTSVTPNTGATIGGTVVTIVGTNFVPGGTTINFGANPATNVICTIAETCTATSPAGAAGVVDVILTDVNGTSAVSAGDKFTYIAPTATLFAWGITAPKGGAVWLPGATAGSGHWWSSDHAQGLCRQDPMSTAPAQFAIAGDPLNALNFAVCGNDLVGSAGQAVYDSRVVVNLATNVSTTFHYVYVPDNAVKSTAVWRLTFNPATETMVADPNGGAMATAMTPLADVRTLKPNGMALGPDGNLYVTDLVEPNVRQITNPNGDPRTQAIIIVAATGDGRGANGTQGFIGNRLYISGNRATQFFDITAGCPILNANGTTTPCGMASVPAPTGVFVAGTITDAPHNRVYISSSPGAANATIYRYDANNDVYVRFAAGSVAPDAFGVVTCPACTVGSQAVVYLTGGLLPNPLTASGAPNGAGGGIVTCALTCQRPWDQGNHPTTGIANGAPVPTSFAFAFGLGMDPSGTLVITEDPSAGARSGRGTMWTVPFIP